ncbi:hypothetical protein [uncultured Desulfosarcina sp.]|uniref:hypothetical protein n=1 Tax=uncultured Desulfosarcina sp. TaxID=218289 RepID=UPI0029C8C11B|nr:hypothetical protein [uncultured Desulfosarcina sp.]
MNFYEIQKQLSIKLWILFFCYAMLAALIFQKFILPLFPSLHAGNGLMLKDAAYFDSIASYLADQIHQYGWGKWQIYPATGAKGNVAILGALYALFGHNTLIVIPVSSALHALGGTLIFLLSRDLGDKTPASTYAGIIAASLFVIFPSALTWYTQNHKDSYMISGVLLILLTWVRAIGAKNRFHSWLLLAVVHLLGILLIGSVRPLNLILLLLSTVGVWLAILVTSFPQCEFKIKLPAVLYFTVAIVMLVGAIKVTSLIPVGNLQKEAVKKGYLVRHSKYTHNKNINKIHWKWSNGSFFPKFVENYFENAAKIRTEIIHHGLSVGARSIIDGNIQPDNAIEFIRYLPRALQVALFAPFPSSWFKETSIQRRIASGEMFIYYLFLPGIFLLFLYNRKPKVFIVLYFACLFLMIYAFAEANLGSLYRHRYGFLFLILMLGSLGWFTWFEKMGWLKRFDKLTTATILGRN